MEVKVIISLASVFVGWLLAQLTGLLKDIHYRRRIKKSLLSELDEIRDEAKRTQLIYIRQLQIFGNGAVGNEVPAPLANHIFKNYYKDAVLILNKTQRTSFQMIHTLLEAANTDIADFRKLTVKIQEKILLEGTDSLTAEDANLWGKTAHANYHNLAVLIWNLSNHIQNPKKPVQELMTEQHESYLKYLDEVKDAADKAIEQGKTADRSFFKKNYHPELFGKTE